MPVARSSPQVASLAPLLPVEARPSYVVGVEGGRFATVFSTGVPRSASAFSAWGGGQAFTGGSSGGGWGGAIFLRPELLC
jgi:hypothetical protein